MSARRCAPVFVVGDVHGYPDRLAELLEDAGLVDGRRWIGRQAVLVLLGDMVDTGPDGIGVLELVMALADQAAQAGGEVRALLGNHEVQLLAARRFAGAFHADWLRRGGQPDDLARLAAPQAAWLAARPALTSVGDDLCMHADAPLYERYGDSIDEVNAKIGGVLQGDDPEAWGDLRDAFLGHHLFRGDGGEERARGVLARYGGSRIVHGHSPIARVRQIAPADVTEPYLYADGRCLNVDHGLYLGGRGFVTRLTRSR